MRLYEIVGNNGQYIQYQFEVDDYIVHLYFETTGPILQCLDEAKHRGNIELGGQYSANKHSGHIPDGKIHLHLYAGQKQIAAINNDGTGHDGYTGTKLPNKVANAIRKIFPEFSIPLGNIIESVPKATSLLIRLEF